MHRALNAHGIAEEYGASDYLIHGGNVQKHVVGRVLAKGLAADEMGDKVYLVVDGVDGRIHHIESDYVRVNDIGKGMIVEIAPTVPKAADRNILEQADANGIYRPSQHLEAISAKISRSGGDPSAFVASHIRRLEALRREGHVERIDDDHWRIPANLPERGMTYDAARGGTGPSIRTLSTLTLERQINSDGATWLDRELAFSNRIPLAKTGFGQRVTIAMDARRQSLVDQGHATWLPKGKIWTSKSLIANLEKAELSRVGQELATKRGMTFVPSRSGEYVSGTLQGSTNLASGRFAMIETVIGNGGLGFQHVPWQPVLEQHLGRHISCVARDSGGIDWSFGRKRGLGL